MTKPISADGVNGMLIQVGFGVLMFRVYNADHTFVDYDIHHADLSVTINDKDAFFYRDGTDRIDHSPATLGIKI